MGFITDKKLDFLKRDFLTEQEIYLKNKHEEYSSMFKKLLSEDIVIPDNFKDNRSNEEFLQAVLTGWFSEDLMLKFLNEKMNPDKIVLDGTDKERDFSMEKVLAVPDYRLISEEKNKEINIELKTWLSIKKDVFLKEYSVNHIRKTNGLVLYYFLQEGLVLFLSYPQILQFPKKKRWGKPGFLINSSYMENKAKPLKNFKKWDLFKYYG